MKGTIRLKQVVWGDQFQLSGEPPKSIYPGVDGAAEYEITQVVEPKDLKPGETAMTYEEWMKATAEQRANVVRISPYTWTVHQPFKQGASFQIDGRNVWSWDGDRDAPTLRPSFGLGLNDPRPDRVIAHLHLTKGKVDLLGDSNVVLAQ